MALRPQELITPCYMINAYEYREISDYSPDENISKETGELTIKQAEEFLDVASSFLAK